MKVIESKYYLNNKEKEDLIKEELDDFDFDEVVDELRSDDLCCRCKKELSNPSKEVDEFYDCEGVLLVDDNILPEVITDNLLHKGLCEKCYKELSDETIYNKFICDRQHIAG